MTVLICNTYDIFLRSEVLLLTCGLDFVSLFLFFRTARPIIAFFVGLLFAPELILTQLFLRNTLVVGVRHDPNVALFFWQNSKTLTKGARFAVEISLVGFWYRLVNSQDPEDVDERLNFR